jgi:hypothetical protein
VFINPLRESRPAYLYNAQRDAGACGQPFSVAPAL